MNNTFLPAQGDNAMAPASGAVARGLSDQLNAVLLEEIECGLIVCDDQGSVRFANHCARQELASGLLMRVAGDVLVGVAGCGSELGAAIRLAIAKGRRQLLRLSAASGRLLVAVTPVQPGGHGPCLALLVLGRRRPCSDLGLELLAKVYHLTLAERRVLGGLMAEATAREIADERHVALSTVRAQIKSIREKMGAPTIDSLLLRAAEMPPIASALRLVAGSAPCTAGPGQRCYPLPMAA